MSTSETNTQKTDTEETNTVVENSESTDKTIRAGKRPSNFSELNRELHALIIYILRKEANEKEPLSPSAVLAEIKKLNDIEFLGKLKDFNITVKTIRVNLEAMYLFSRKCDKYESQIFKSIYFGRLHRYHKEGDTYIRDTGKKEDPNNRKTYYSFESVFSAQELLMLQSCVETNPYIDPHDSTEIIEKIKGLSECSLYKNIWHQKETPINIDLNIMETSPNVDSNSGKLMKNLTDLIYHIEMDHQIVITYGMYEYDFQKKFIKLVPKRLAKNGNPKAQIIDPVAVLWANGFCYLVAHTPRSKDAEDVIVYRVDRIMSIISSIDSRNKIIKVDPDVRDYKKRFNSLKYLKEHPVMHSGDAERIVMLVKNAEDQPIVNLLYDTFGKNITLYNYITDENARKYMHCSATELKARGETWYTAALDHASIQGAVLWAKQNIDRAVIIAPNEAVERLTSSVREGLARYQ